MKAEEIKRIREDLDMSRDELAELLCLSGYQAMMNIETDFRRPSKLAIRLLRYLDSLPRAKALAFIEELKRHEPK
jgi:DNA-binding transcriptional regulator YiaG